jgi:hypothetical protein
MAGHASYRARLQALADKAALAAALDAWRERAGSGEGGPWRQDYGRFYPGQDPWAVLVFESGPLVVRADVHEQAADDRVRVDGVGHVLVSGLARDRALPGMSAVLGSLADARVVRYRPGKRCTLAGSVAGAVRFVKVVPDPSPLYRDAVELWRTACHDELTFTVAEPHGMDRSLGALWQGVVPGTPVLKELSGTDGAALARRLGSGLASLARSSAAPSTAAGPEVQLARTGRAAARAAHRVPGLDRQLRVVVDLLRRRHAVLTPRPLVPVHGAPHVHQWLADGPRLGLIDFDRFARGEPELDVATFLAELDGDRSLSVPVASLEEGLLQGYRDGGIELAQDRLQLHRSHKRLAKVTRAAWSLRPDGDARAASHLQRVCADLGI